MERLDFDESQLKAISACCNSERRVVAVTGEAGTGKTTILQNVYETLTARGYNVVLCAPTGKAAKRITEATNIPAKTVHRLLEYPYPKEINEKTGKPLVSSDPKRDRMNPILENVVLCDEYAMVNVELHRNLLDALPNGGLIRMFGDANQLQPIETTRSKKQQQEPSSFLKMLDKFDGIWLKRIHRQKEGSNIISNGHRIIQGLMPIRREDFAIKMTNEPVTAVQDFLMDNLANEIDYGTLNNQVISPTKVGWVGCIALNASVQQLLQPSNKYYVELERHKYSKEDYMRVYEGDKVVFTVNTYSLEVFNGETGIVTELKDDGSVEIDFGDRKVDIPMSLEMESRDGTYHINPQKNIDLAYVITTHKAQGSEYDRVCYVMNKSRSWILNRKNLYTGITRAKSYVTMITDQTALTRSLMKKGDK